MGDTERGSWNATFLTQYIEEKRARMGLPPSSPDLNPASWFLADVTLDDLYQREWGIVDAAGNVIARSGRRENLEVILRLCGGNL